MNIQDKQHLDICWKVFEEDELSFVINRLDLGHKIRTTAPDKLDVRSRFADWCEKNNIELVYVDCRTITEKEAHRVRCPHYYDDKIKLMVPNELDENYTNAVRKCFENKLYLIDHISEIPDGPDQESIYNIIIHSWKDRPSCANVIFVENSDSSIVRKPYLRSMGGCGYRYYGDIVFDPTVEPSGQQKYVMSGKIELYKELSK